MLPHSNGKKSRRPRRKRHHQRSAIISRLQQQPQLWLLVLPAIVLLCVWIRLVRRVDIIHGSSSSAAQISPERLGVVVGNDPLLRPIAVERGRRDELHEKKAAATVEKSKKQPKDIHRPIEKNKKQKNIVEAVDEEAPKDTKPDADATHHHAIPNIITFTHSINLLNTTTKVTGEDVALQRNVQNTIQLHPNAEIHFLTDDDCLASIRRVLGNNSPLVHFFQDETHGMYKADICRGASLYETGGLYFDVDIQARMPMWNAISSLDTTFVTSRVHRQSKHPGAFFQAFIGVTPQNPIMMRYLELFIKHYQGHIDVQGPLGVLLLRKAHDEIMMQEEQNVELWQEVLYNKQLFPNVPPPSWGTRRACHFVVVANHKKRPFVVPLYSRVQGSRMCGGKESSIQKKNLRGAR